MAIWRDTPHDVKPMRETRHAPDRKVRATRRRVRRSDRVRPRDWPTDLKILRWQTTPRGREAPFRARRSHRGQGGVELSLLALL